MSSKISAVVIISLSALLLFLFSCNPIRNPADTAAAAGLVSYKSLVKQGIAMGLPEDSFALASNFNFDSLYLGLPIKLYIIRLDSIKSSNTVRGQNMLYDVHRIIYPILYHGSVISGEILQEDTAGNWKVRNYGDQQGIQAFQAYSQQIHFNSVPDMVRIPSFSVEFMDGRINNMDSLIYLGEPVIDSLTKGLHTTIKDVTLKLRPAALAMDTTGP